ncbi:hypothetical protein COV24_03155 [candidate division WWE3 bacterium CG10_big_fil_rev_8_21_14_0_10_32_10]|uniref:Antitoxin n=1 Tax=candidate division WWE3 bacterium CG10_big_fil_rev_8_21_14_0_10_32_10 TaxID=1975090 RepID=A0A2H0R9Z8_UNCKA|nr:MAG: hypothetical protein COV24_03155 [candidate division WWE3 bacterium CG10_big_fil_rev_8_21_14_0_10_32_10]
MNTKLTLSMDPNIINKAKKNLQTKEKSLSSIIEDYFKILIATKTKKTSDTPIVGELTGIASTSKKTNKTEIISNYLLEKYK